MKKYLTLIIGLIFVLVLAGCSSQEVSDVNDKNTDSATLIAGQWKYYGYNEEERLYNVVFNLEDNADFEITVEDAGTTEGSAVEKTAIVKGTYTEDGQQFELDVTEVDDPDGLIATDVKADSTVVIDYEIGPEDDSLILPDLSPFIPTLPSQIVLERVQ